MNGEATTPSRAPRPNPVAFSTGALKKKHQIEGDRYSLPAVETPETPYKSQKSKFIVPTSLSPFAYSPKNINRSDHSNHPLSTPGKTKLSASYSVFMDTSEGDSPFDVKTSCYSTGTPTRSSSPIGGNNKTGKYEDVFGLSLGDMEDDDDFDDLDSHGPFDSTESPPSVAAHSPAINPPWKSVHAVFFDKEYFQRPDWTHPHSLIDFHASEHAPSYLETHFDILDLIGRGSFSDVFRVRKKGQMTTFALKRSRMPFSGFVDRQRRLEEVLNLWLAANHPHCIQIYSAWEQQGYLHILMELCDNGSLRDVIDYMAQSQARFTEYQVWQILHQIASGVQNIHLVDIVHLDIKPANILINAQGVLKIGDFGLSMRVGTIHDPDSEGDKYYMAPETLDGIYDKPADIFSLGLLILELATDVQLPSQGSSWQNLRHGDYSDLSFDDTSESLKALIKLMTDPDPSRRPTIAQVLYEVERSVSKLSES